MAGGAGGGGGQEPKVGVGSWEVSLPLPREVRSSQRLSETSAGAGTEGRGLPLRAPLVTIEGAGSTDDSMDGVLAARGVPKLQLTALVSPCTPGLP